jgi:cytoskeleton protein RodZ
MADRTRPDFGRSLREARERRGVSLRQIATATKIGLHTLEALERNDIARLPGGIFSRGIVKSYAAEIGLDPEHALRDFIAQFPHDPVVARLAAPPQGEDHQAVESDRRAATTFVRLVAISIPIAVALMYFAAVGRRESAQAPASPSAPSEPAVEASPDVTAAVSPLATLSEPPGAIAPVATSGATDRLVVTVIARRQCLVSATVDGEKTFERLMQAGERQTLDARNEVVLTAADASAISVTLNGSAAKPLGAAGEPVTARLNLHNVHEYVAAR